MRAKGCLHEWNAFEANAKLQRFPATTADDAIPAVVGSLSRSMEKSLGIAQIDGAAGDVPRGEAA
ncbi:hypothetical protein PI87_23985 [Ralstonia sp. A12]|nr:hypothetical protein PI87_23985 [Ralstonia sp. A12]